MAGPQFAHIQTWSLKPNKAGQSILQVIKEATRDPEYSVHVEAPKAPRVLLGDPFTFEADHAAHVAARATVVRMKDGTERARAIRQDRHTMASIVMSYPVPRAAIRTDEDRARLESWKQRNLEWLRETYGDQLRVVLEHDDEEHPHLHAWLLPDDPGADATTLHPGKMAKKAAEAAAKEVGTPAREAVKLGNQALKAAMTVWQDAYYEAVGVPEGLTRTGPKRRRLTRQQWKAEKVAAAATARAAAEVEANRRASIQVRWNARCERRAASAETRKLLAMAADEARAKAAAFESLAGEIARGTVGKDQDGKLVVADVEALRPALPHIGPAIRAAADASSDLQRHREAAAKAQAEAEENRDKLKAAVLEGEASLARIQDAEARLAENIRTYDAGIKSNAEKAALLDEREAGIIEKEAVLETSIAAAAEDQRKAASVLEHLTRAWDRLVRYIWSDKLPSKVRAELRELAKEAGRDDLPKPTIAELAASSAKKPGQEPRTPGRDGNSDLGF